MLGMMAGKRQFLLLNRTLTNRSTLTGPRRPFVQRCRDDEDGEIILEYLMDGFKPGDIAVELGMSSQEVYAIVRRIKRKIRERCSRPAH